ncbi:MAG: 1-(5-phosphoribosyl)-5-((5-phosphoribosylamino)methylideneamino)imidazole-4-carboxamide isomerase, partial [Clostridia bacterium]|nr:1-(5-phosphoribosyl)-5-((5-phosphoribosylamino)methylideneamino)imidazole-4-carboxamide isomerase [Clostridia bacterium]
ALKMKSFGIKTVIYTDIATDGMLKGPNLEAMKEMLEKTGMDVIASGGVSEEKDLENLENCGVSGAIVGKAIYDGRVDLEKVLKRW